MCEKCWCVKCEDDDGARERVRRGVRVRGGVLRDDDCVDCVCVGELCVGVFECDEGCVVL